MPVDLKPPEKLKEKWQGGLPFFAGLRPDDDKGPDSKTEKVFDGLGFVHPMQDPRIHTPEEIRRVWLIGAAFAGLMTAASIQWNICAYDRSFCAPGLQLAAHTVKSLTPTLPQIRNVIRNSERRNVAHAF
jgi:hypothetical protein